jgi:hypothetical protein
MMYSNSYIPDNNLLVPHIHHMSSPSPSQSPTPDSNSNAATGVLAPAAVAAAAAAAPVAALAVAAVVPADSNSNSNPATPVNNVISYSTITSTTTVNVTNAVPAQPPSPPNIPPIVNFTLNETLSTAGAVVTNQQGQSASGDGVTHTTFSTISHPDNDAVAITQDLGQVVQSYFDNTTNPLSESNIVLQDIKAYAAQIKCENFHGKGTIDDYSELFHAASKIANETKQMQLNVDIEGFDEFGAAADELSTLFNGFIVKLQSINIIDDLNFLKAVRSALAKIARLADVFGEFKKTIIATATVELPKSAHEARLVVQDVMSEINCAMNYISHFVNPSESAPTGAALSAVEQNIIDKAVDTIENWSVLCDQGVSVAMSNSPDIIYMKSANQELKTKSNILKTNISSLRTKLTAYSRI